MIHFEHTYDCDDAESCFEVFSCFDNMHCSVTIVDMSISNHPIIYANTTFYHLTGYDAKAVLGSNCCFLNGKDTDKATINIIDNALTTRNSIEIEVLNYRKDGTPFWNLLRLYQLHTRNPNLNYFIGLHIDISNVLNKDNRKITVNDLHNERLMTIGAMSAGIAHEINNPIFGVLMNIAYLKNKTSDPDALAAIEQSQTELERVGKIVQNLLGFSRKKEMYKNKKIELHDLIIETINLAKTQVHYKWINIDLQLPDLLPFVFANEDSVKQILLNLIMNAIHSLIEDSIEHPRIKISVGICPIDQMVTVSVIDNGKGVPIELQEKIFMPFFTTKKEGQGTGLGLSLAASMAQEFGGHLLLNKHHTNGANFQLQIPIFSEISKGDTSVDKTCLESMKTLLEDNFKEVISLYMNELISTLNAIDEARLAQDWLHLDKLVHALKGSSLSICCHGVAQQCIAYRNILNLHPTVNEEDISHINAQLQQCAYKTIELLTRYIAN
jgi:PAS domain S-box-containing protein